MIDDDQAVYWRALERIKDGQTRIVPAGERITFDLVCLEAGRGRGSLKASRLQHLSIRDAIKSAAESQLAATPKAKKAVAKQKTMKQRDDVEHYRRLYEESLGREIILLKHVDFLEQENAKLRKPRVVPFSPRQH